MAKVEETRDKQSSGNRVSLTQNNVAAGGPYSMRYSAPQTGEPGSIVTGGGADWFGPLNPMVPTAPLDVKGRVLDYQSGYNLNVRPRSGELVSFEMLRAFADNYDLLRLLIETRKDQMARMNWNITPRDKSYQKTGGEIPDDLKARIKVITEFLYRPDKELFWHEWLGMVLEDMFVIDAATIYRRRTRGGQLYALQQIDGATIKRVIDDWGNTPEPPAPAYQQVLKGYPAVNYEIGELIYKPRVKRVHKVYGYSPVEQILMTINIGMRRQVWQLQSFTEGNVPEALIGTPDTWTPDQVRQFQDWFDSMLQGNTGERRRARFVPGEVAKSYVPTKTDELFGAAEEWLVRVMCFAFSVSPQPFVKMMNRATAETAHEAAISEGLAPVQNWVKTLIDTILIDDFDSPDLEFGWEEEDELDPDVKSQIIDREQKAGRMTLNETRKEQGQNPFNDPEADRPMVFIATQGWVPVLLNDEEKALKDAQNAAAQAGAVASKDAFENPPDPAAADALGGDAAKPGATTSPKASAKPSVTPPKPGEVAKKSDRPFPEDRFSLKADGKTVSNGVSKADWNEDDHPRDEHGRFGDGGGGITASEASNLQVSEHLVGKVTVEQVNDLRQAISDREPQSVVLEKMAPIYQAIPSAGEATLVLDENGKPPEGFFEGREYDVNGEKVGITAAIDHLTTGAAGFAGKEGPSFDKVATILVGPSAAGKSTFAEQIAADTRSAIVDPDEAKQVVPGYNGGLGANEVHEESSQMSRMVEARMIETGANIVIPAVGANAGEHASEGKVATGIQARVDRLQAAGYNVHIVDVHVDKDEATRRMAERAIRTGRPIGRDYVINVGDKPSRTYEKVKESTNGYARINANGPIGSDRVTESYGIGYLATGQSVLRKSGESDRGFRGSLGIGGIPRTVRSEESRGLQKIDLGKVAGKKTLYVARSVTNGEDIVKWAKDQGFKTTLPVDDIHVTVCYSKEPVDWDEMSDSFDSLKSSGSEGRSLEEFDGGAVVLRIELKELSDRWQEFKDGGASWDYDEYHPHLTITYDRGDVDLSKVEVYDGDILFGPEEFKEINTDWKEKPVEKGDWNEDDHPRDEHGRFGAGGGPLTPKEERDGRKALKVYAGKASGLDINRGIREGTLTAEQQKTVNDLARFIDGQKPLPEGTELFRGVPMEKGLLEPGVVLKDPAFLSVSGSSNKSLEFAHGSTYDINNNDYTARAAALNAMDKTLFVIDASGAQSLKVMDNMAMSAVNANVAAEQEHILPMGTSIRVDSVERVTITQNNDGSVTNSHSQYNTMNNLREGDVVVKASIVWP